jgi:hypothetical protein
MFIWIALVLGILIATASLWFVISPRRWIELVQRAIATSLVHIIAARLVFGVVLLVAAPDSAEPLFYQVLGWAAIASAPLIPVVGLQRIHRITAWAANQPPTMVRALALIGVTMGGAIAWGAIG